MVLASKVASASDAMATSCVDLIAAHGVGKFADRTAVSTANGVTVTYADLVARAAALACWLRPRLGAVVPRGEVGDVLGSSPAVGCFVDEGCEMIVAWLAIAWAGEHEGCLLVCVCVLLCVCVCVCVCVVNDRENHRGCVHIQPLPLS